MGVCENCGRGLDRAWKFCIYCGAAIALPVLVPVAVETGAESASAGRHAESTPAEPVAEPRAEPAQFIPNAIRPGDADAAPARKSKIDVPLLVGIMLALGGAGMIVYLAVLFLLPHA